MRRQRRHDPRQLQFLAALDKIATVEVPTEPDRAEASHDIDQKTRRWLNEAITASPLSRGEIADAMTVLSARQVTKAMLDTWSGAARPNRFPADLIPAFCIAAGNTHLLDRLAEDCGMRVSDTTEARLAKIGQWSLFVAYADEQQRALASQLPPLPLLKGVAR